MNQHLPKHTKIVATLGPSSSDLDTIRQLIVEGVNVFRLNFSHGVAADHEQRAAQIHQAAQELKTSVAILADLQGPKIRIAKFAEGAIELVEGQGFSIDSGLPSDAGNQQQVGTDFKTLHQDVSPGDVLLLDDGRIVFDVVAVEGTRIDCLVKVSGKLSNNKGINKLGGGISADCLTDKDKQDLLTAVKLNTAYIAISFPRNAEDMNYARQLMQQAGGSAHLVAKIERAEAMECIDDIIEASDAVMVARGDLGVEIGDDALPGAQKHIIARARALDKPVITATQMMETMIENSIPTRAEVSDVANAVIDYTDAVMLSAETAAGKHPIDVVKAMSRICLGAESGPCYAYSKHHENLFFQSTEQAIAMAAMYLADHADLDAIVCITASGATPLRMSRIRTDLPIYAFSPNPDALKKMCLYRGVFPIALSMEGVDLQNIHSRLLQQLTGQQLLLPGHKVLITSSDNLAEVGSTNALKILTI